MATFWFLFVSFDLFLILHGQHDDAMPHESPTKIQPITKKPVPKDIFGNQLVCNTTDSCNWQEFQCRAQSKCKIICSEKYACSNSIFHCPDDGECEIYCNNDGACLNITVKAETSSALHIHVGEHRSVMLNANIYVPNQGEHKTAIINCGNGKSEPCKSMNIYSKYGFADVNLECSYVTCLSDSTMFCMERSDGYEYGSSCDVICNTVAIDIGAAECTWTCANERHTCAKWKTPMPTESPSTPRPTPNPTTTPSMRPSINPTEAPTIEPTYFPTMNPVQDGQVRSMGTTSFNMENVKNGHDNDDSTALVIIVSGLILLVMLFLVLLIGYLVSQKRKKLMVENSIALDNVQSASSNDVTSMETPSHPSARCAVSIQKEYFRNEGDDDDESDGIYEKEEGDGICSGNTVTTPRNA